MDFPERIEAGWFDGELVCRDYHVAEGRDHVMGLIKAPNLQPGAFYLQGVPGDTRDPQPQDPQARAKLVALSEKLTGVAFTPR